MSASDADYRHALSEIIKAQIVILGPNIAFARLHSIGGIKYNPNGEVTAFLMDPQKAFQAVIREYTSLSPMVVRKSINKVLEKYPQINLEEVGQSGNLCLSFDWAQFIYHLYGRGSSCEK